MHHRRVSIAAFFLLAVLLAGTAEGGCPGFEVSQQLPNISDTNSYAVALGDFNGDGFIDIVNGAAFIPGKGDGTFGPPRPYGPDPAIGGHRVAADFNRDGHLDLTNGVTVYLGAGDGSWTAQLPITPVPAAAPRMAVADFNRDTLPDLALTSAFEHKVLVLLGNGDGTFRSAPDLFSGTATETVAAGDFDDDGRADLAVQTHTEPDWKRMLWFAHGAGDGTFAAPVMIDSSFEAPPVVADFDGDRHLDILGDNELLFGNGNGTFTTVTVPATRAVAAGDLNGDGRADAVAVDRDYFAVYLSTAARGLSSPNVYLSAPAAYFAHPADLNRDGVQDLVIAGGGALAPVLGKGDGRFFERVGGLVGGIYAIGDFNGDGLPDIVTTDRDIGAAALRIATNGGSAPWIVGEPFAGATTPQSIVTADFDRDGRLDIAVADLNHYCSSCLTSGLIRVFRHTSSAWAASTVLLGTNPSWLIARDFDGDGNVDLAARTVEGAAVTYGTGTGSFVDAKFDATPVSRLLGAGDFDGDGRLDIAAIAANRDLLIYSIAARAIAAPRRLTMSTEVSAATVGDFNRDGIADLVAIAGEPASGVNDRLELFTGATSIGLTALSSYTLAVAASAVALGDLDGDSKPDIAVSADAPNSITIYRGSGTGSFGAAMIADAGSRTGGAPMVMADMNADGHLDLVTHVIRFNTCGVAPVVTSIDPEAGPVAGGQRVLISGSNLYPAISITLDGQAMPIEPSTGSGIVLVTPPHDPGTVSLSVTTLSGSTTVPLAYRYAALPVISGSSASDRMVTIAGSGLEGATVRVGGIDVPLLSGDATHISFIIPPGMGGIVFVTITTPGGVAQTAVNLPVPAAGVPLLTDLGRFLFVLLVALAVWVRTR